MNPAKTKVAPIATAITDTIETIGETIGEKLVTKATPLKRKLPSQTKMASNKEHVTQIATESPIKRAKKIENINEAYVKHEKREMPEIKPVIKRHHPQFSKLNHCKHQYFNIFT